MAITPLPTAPSRDRPGTFVSEANAFLGALPVLGTEINVVSSHMMTLEGSTYAAMTQAQQAAANAAASVNHPSYTGTSVSSLDLSFGVKTVAAPTGKNWNGGMVLQLWADATHFMSGTVIAYVDGTLTINITNVTGGGTFSNWAISVLPSITGLSAAHVISALGYEPVKPNGTGATGNWNINITGNALTVTTVTAANIQGALGYLPPANDGRGSYGTWPIHVHGWAGAVEWANVANRPSLLSQFGNDVGFITAAGRAFPRKADGGPMDVHWAGQPGQPTWLLGSISVDGSSWAVFNPSNFRVAYAADAGVAGSANSVHWSVVIGRPVNVSQFANDAGYAQTAWVTANHFNTCDTVWTRVGFDPTMGVGTTRITDVQLQDMGPHIRLAGSYVEGSGFSGS